MITFSSFISNYIMKVKCQPSLATVYSIHFIHLKSFLP